MFGLSARDTGRRLQDLELSYRPLELRSHIETVASERRAVTVRGVEWQRGNDRQWYDVTVQPLVAGTGRLEGTAVTYTVVTSQRRLQEELDRSRVDLETAYEEMQSTVEELETTNEQLQTTNEQLQTTNEELETMNDELRQRSTELDDVNGFLEAILSSLRSAVVVVDRDVRIQAWNRHAEELWGLRADEVEGEHLMNLDIGLPLEHLRQPIGTCLVGNDASQVVLDAVNRKGRAIECHVRATPLRGPDGGSIGAILLMDAGDATAGPVAR
jgi:two-component system CheB/CheR fusion protein